MFTLTDVLQATGGRLVAGSSTQSFTAISIDSRTAKPGNLFAAFRGEQQDGHEYVADALQRGAVGAIVDHTVTSETWSASRAAGPSIVMCPNTGKALEDLARFWRRKHDVTVIGVTGSVGKTTTKEIIAGLLAQHGAVLRSPANYNTEIGLPITLMELDEEQRVAVLEMGMHDVGEIRRLASIALPDIGVVTNVHPTHLERLGTIERIAQAKRELVEALPLDGLGLLNADDERVRGMAPGLGCRVLTYGRSADADVRATDITSLGLGGTEFVVHLGGQERRTVLPMPGVHFVNAALAAIAIAADLHVPFEDAADGLRELDIAVAGRMRPIAGLLGTMILDDAYNASPASTIAALDLLAETNGRRVAVLGDMLELGAYEQEGHRAVGRRAAEAADVLVTVGHRALEIANEARAAGMSTALIESFECAEEALPALRFRLQPGDSVLIKASHGMRLDVLVDALRATSPTGSRFDSES